jgi:sporulation protein YlmC with PRC-barrel domain
MIIRAKNIIGTKVITQAGQQLGKVVDFEINSLEQNITKYYVQGEFLRFLKEPLMIDASQVIEIKQDRIIVEDSVISEKETEKKVAMNYAK